MIELIGRILFIGFLLFGEIAIAIAKYFIAKVGTLIKSSS